MSAPPLADTGLDHAPIASSAPLLSAHPAVRANERFALAFTPAWIAVIATLMLTRSMAAWGDVEHLVLGVALAVPPWIWALTSSARGVEPTLPLSRHHAMRHAVAIAITTLLQTWFGSALFFNQLGMEYHFHTTWLLARTPVFLYLVTIAYFTTYYCLLLVADRQIQRRLAHAPRALRLTLRFALCYAIAFGETWFMASGLIDDFFSYRDRHFALLVGSIGYGWLFFATLPVFTKIERSAGQDRPSLSAVARDALAANMLSLVGYEIFAHVVGKPF